MTIAHDIEYYILRYREQAGPFEGSRAIDVTELILKRVNQEINDIVDELDTEMISSRPDDDVKVFTIKEAKARQISIIEELREKINK